jgi:predicted ATPase/DNA-binding SARP family transcriptional activator
LRSRKSVWLLALLALRAGDHVDREWLAATLWPESQERQAFANLRTCLKDLRRALGPEAGRITAPTTRSLSLDLTDAVVDVRTFDAGMARGDLLSLTQAVALYRGPLLEGCAEEWVLPERNAREQACLQALETLAAGALAAGDPSAAISHLRQAIALDPLRESAQRALMQALAASGSYAAAELVYRELRTLLHREINAAPDPETTALAEQLRTAAHRMETAPDGKAESVPALSTPHNLPVPPTPLLGRHQEIMALSVLLRGSGAAARHSAARLVTLTGPGGTGKTRLALEVAAHLLDAFPDGVFLVSLAPIRDPELLLSTLAQILGLREQSSRSLQDVVVEYLRERQLMLLLDNFEQLLPAAPHVAELLAAAPRLKVLVTSRAPLRLRGEREFPVRPLALPDRMAPPETLCQYAAVALFIERAQAVQPEFAVTSTNAPAVAAICQRLDGLPLAIELAAVRIKLFPPEVLLSRLSHRLRLLVGGQGDLPARQQTLRQTFAWSYELLSDAEKQLFRRLSVFVGGCAAEAVTVVCTDGEASFSSDAIIDRLASLVDQSLLQRENTSEGELRFTMLETIREYAREQLDESGEAGAVRRRHAQFFLSLAKKADWAAGALGQKVERAPGGPGERVWMDRLEREHGNLRATLDWFVETGEAEAGLQLGTLLQALWAARGYLGEGRERLGGLLALPGTEGTAIRALALTRTGALAGYQGDFDAARALHQESLEIARKLGDQQITAMALNNLASMIVTQGDYVTASTLYQESLRIARQLGDRRGVAIVLTCLANVACDQGSALAAQPYYEESLSIARELGDQWQQANTLIGLGDNVRSRGDYASARSYLEQSLAIGRDLNNKRIISDVLYHLAIVEQEQGNAVHARALFQECLEIQREMGDQAGIASCLEQLEAANRLSLAEARTKQNP